MSRSKINIRFNQKTPPRNFADPGYDTYKTPLKYPEPTVCTQCGSVYEKGKWTWSEIPDDYHKEICPACRRIEDHYAAGSIKMSGTFFNEHKTEILHMIANVEKAEKSLHPLERIMSISSDNGNTEILTTGMHIANRIGNHLYDAYKGNLQTQYDSENMVRIEWSRA
jgi:hypothetical protein